MRSLRGRSLNQLDAESSFSQHLVLLPRLNIQTIQTCGPSLFVDHFVSANRFGEFTLDLARGGFFRSGEGAKLSPKVFEVLKYLVEYPRRLIGKEKLAKAIWLDNFVRTGTESSQTG